MERKAEHQDIKSLDPGDFGTATAAPDAYTDVVSGWRKCPSCLGHWPLGPFQAFLPTPHPTTHFIGLADGPQGDPHGAHHCVPDETLVPHFHCQPQIQAVNLTVEKGEGEGKVRSEGMETQKSQFTHTANWYLHQGLGES